MENPPRLPDRYRLVRPLGEGGSGRVWLVEDRQWPGRRVALKQWAAPAGRERELQHEFVTLTQLRHPNLVEVHELPPTAGGEAAYFTLEFVDGEDIVSAIRREGPPLLPALAAEGLRALAFLHDFGLVHRDLKPGNLLVRTRPRLDCRLVVLDFGLALHGEAVETATARTTAGTLPYLAPELFDGAAPGTRSDLYALGAVLYEAVHGRPPFRYEDDLPAFIDRVRSGRRARPAVPAGFPEGLAAWLEELLSPDPAKRPAGAAEALARFNAACGTSFPSETAAGRAARLSSGAPPGREREIAALWELLQPADQPRLVWLCGSPGSGKQRVLRWLAGDALTRGFEVQVGTPGRLAADPAAERDVDAFLQRLRRSAGTVPTLLLLQEVETAGSRVASFLERVAREERAAPLRVVAALRTAEVRQPALLRLLEQSGRVPTVARVDLPALDTAALEKMVVRAGGNRSPSPARLRWLAEATEGNLALAESLIVEGLWDVGRRVRRSVAVDRSLDARLSDLPPDAARLLEALSTLGEGAGEALLAGLTGLTEEGVREAGAALYAVGLACGRDGSWSVESRASAGFVLGRLDPERRSAAFLEAARLLQDSPEGRPELLARLWDGGGDRERAAAAARDAARQAMGEGDPVRAAQHLAFALLQLERGDPRRGDWRLEQAAALRAANMPQAAARAYGAALRWNRDPARQGDILARQAAMLIQAGRFARGRQAAERALALARSHADAQAQARAKEAIGLALGREGRGRDALPWFEESVAEFCACDDRPAQAHALQSMALCEANEGLPGAREHFEQARELFDAAGSATQGLMSLVGLACLEQRGARWGRARKMLEEARRLAATQHNVLLEGLVSCTLAQNALLEGRFAETVARSAEAADQARFVGDDRLWLAASTARATALARCGRPAEAAELMEDALGRPHGKVDPVIVELARLALIEARLGGAPAAQEIGPLLRQSLDATRRLGDPDAVLLALTLELERRSRGGDVEPFDELRQEFDACVSRPGSWNQPHHIVVADLQQAAEEARRDDLVAAERSARKAARRAAELDLPGLEARALAWLCDVLARGGQHEAAAGAQEEGRARLERAAERIEDADLRRGFVERRVFAGLKRPVGFASSVNRRLLALYDMIRALNSESNPDALLVSTLDMALEVVGAERGMILLRDPGSEAFAVRVARNLEKETIEDAEAFSHGIVAQAGAGRSVLAHDASSDERFRELKSVSLYGIHSLMCVPLRSRGAIVGTVYLDNRSKGRLFQPEDLRFLEAFADHASMALENARTRERLIHENLKLQEAAERQVRFGNIVGRSPAMCRVFDLIEKVADSELPVLIQGETGTGKELVARAVHFNGPRAKRIFVSENCAAIPDSLLQSELFGHVRGAFTGAESDRAGLFEQAHGGTLFLDEVGDMSPGMQSQLLRAIQEGEIRRVGADRPIHVDVRLLAATNRDLQRDAAEGRFREDLMYRLQVLVIHLPPLRRRAEDIPLLIDYFLERIAEERGRKPPPLDPDVRRRLLEHRWPGNVRQLEGTLQRLALLAGEGPIGRELVEQDPALSRALGRAAPAPVPSLSLGRSEREKIAQALGAAGGNRSRAARLLGISRATIYRKIKEYGLV